MHATNLLDNMITGCARDAGLWVVATGWWCMALSMRGDKGCFDHSRPRVCQKYFLRLFKLCFTESSDAR